MTRKKLTGLDPKTINKLARKYDVLAYFYQLASILKDTYPSESFEQYPKYALHKIFNDILLAQYAGEEIHKFYLFDYFQQKKNLVGAFEMRVDKSRVDFLTINGKTTSFEIKSALDNLSRLDKQIGDYDRAFEYNYLVLDEKHISSLPQLPKHFGVWGYENGKYFEHKKALLSQALDSEFQLRLLTKAELNQYFNDAPSVKKVLRLYTDTYINRTFKKILKERYKARWQFVKSHPFILPIDLQFFFNTNIHPSHIYQ